MPRLFLVQTFYNNTPVVEIKVLGSAEQCSIRSDMKRNKYSFSINFLRKCVFDGLV
jgi:hypothetical protein